MHNPSFVNVDSLINTLQRLFSGQHGPNNPDPDPPVEIPPDDPNKPLDRPKPAPVKDPSPADPGKWA